MTLFKQSVVLVLFVLVLNYFYPAQKKSDLVRERMIYDQSLSEVFDGEHSYINYKYGEFSSLEIYNDDKDSAILYLHGRGLSPNDYNLAHPIRTQFSGNFNTYNIQLPVLKKGATYNDYVDILYDSDQRIISAIEYISSKNDRIRSLLPQQTSPLLSSSIAAGSSCASASASIDGDGVAVAAETAPKMIEASDY